MKRIMVRYRVKPSRVEENEHYIAQVFGQLERDRPAGLRYASLKLEDGVSFVHVVSVETKDGTNPLTALSAFKMFTANIEERCDEAPRVTTLTEVGSYRFFD